MEIEILRKHSFSLRRIAVELGCAVNTVRSHLASQAKPKYGRRKQGTSKLSGYETYLRERQAAAHPLWIPASVLQREIATQGYQGGLSQLRSYLRGIRPTLPLDPVVRFETMPSEQMQVDWVELRKGKAPLYAFCAPLGYSRASHVNSNSISKLNYSRMADAPPRCTSCTISSANPPPLHSLLNWKWNKFVTDMKVGTLIDCHQKAFVALGGVPMRILYDNMKTVVFEREVDGPGAHRYHAGFLDYAKHCGFVIKLCRPYRARTKGKVERFNGYLRRSFYVPLVAKLKQAGLLLDVVTANVEVRDWLKEVANERIHGTTQVKPSTRLQEEQSQRQAVPAAWRGDVAAARPQEMAVISEQAAVRPSVIAERIEAATPLQHPLAVYEQLLVQCRISAEVAP